MGDPLLAADSRDEKHSSETYDVDTATFWFHPILGGR